MDVIASIRQESPISDFPLSHSQENICEISLQSVYSITSANHANVSWSVQVDHKWYLKPIYAFWSKNCK